MRELVTFSLVFTFSLALGASASAQGRKKPTSYPGTADFRCEGTVGGCPGSPDPDDGVLGQFTPENTEASYPGTGTPEGGRGAFLRETGEMWIGLRDGFMVRLDFGRRMANATVHCDPNCQYSSTFGDVTSVLIGETSYAEIHSNVVGADGDTTPSLFDVSTDPDNPSTVRLLMSFYDGSGRLWNFNFSDARNSGSGNASVYRIADTCSWVFTDGGSLAELSTLVKKTGKQFRSFEGLYAAPFEFTFTASACPQP